MSVFSSLRYCLGDATDKSNLYIALAFLPFGLFFDFMDGRVARWRKKSSMMGQELDSLADLVRRERKCPLRLLHLCPCLQLRLHRSSNSPPGVICTRRGWREGDVSRNGDTPRSPPRQCRPVGSLILRTFTNAALRP